jgi:flavin reductase (DIM6/NTAB) family NADH-FMN oxidoreductase RutF
MNTGTYHMIRDSGCFAINMLGNEHRTVAEIFAGRGGITGDERFRTGAWGKGATLGLPILGSASALECEVSQIVNAGTHAVIFGHIKGATLNRIDPLVYHAGAFRSLVDMQARLAS